MLRRRSNAVELLDDQSGELALGGAKLRAGWTRCPEVDDDVDVPVCEVRAQLVLRQWLVGTDPRPPLDERHAVAES